MKWYKQTTKLIIYRHLLPTSTVPFFMSKLIWRCLKSYCYFILRAACFLARKESRGLFGDLGENDFRLTLDTHIFLTFTYSRPQKTTFVSCPSPRVNVNYPNDRSHGKISGCDLGSERKWRGYKVASFPLILTCMRKPGVAIVPCLHLKILNTIFNNNNNEWRQSH